MPRFLAIILISQSLFFPFAGSAQAEILAPEAPDSIPVYLFTSDQGEILAIAPLTEDIFIWAYTNPHAATNINNVTSTYDTNGNLTSDSLWTHTWDYRNRLTQSTKSGATSTYSYDHANTRVKLQTTSSTTVIPTQFYSTEVGTAVKYIYANGQLVATIRGSGASSTSYYIHSDHLGSLEKTTDSSSTITELSDYYPYLSVRQDSGSIDDRKGFPFLKIRF